VGCRPEVWHVLRTIYDKAGIVKAAQRLRARGNVVRIVESPPEEWKYTYKLVYRRVDEKY
jgi:hypothetical protein